MVNPDLISGFSPCLRVVGIIDEFRFHFSRAILNMIFF
jgi:hypothetical protein